MATDSARGISPAIGVVLLFSITVLLAATLATVALAIDTPAEPDFRQSLSSDTSTADFAFAASRGRVTITHDGGDALSASKVTIETGDESIRWADSGDVTEGDSRTVSASEVRVVYAGEALAEYER